MVGRAYGCGLAKVRSNEGEDAREWGAVSLRKGESREEWGGSIEKSGGSTGESRAKVRCCGGKSTYTRERRGVAVAAVGSRARATL